MDRPIDNIKDRIKKGLSLRNMQAVELSEKTGIPKSSISQYMSGYASPKSDRIFLIAKALNVSETWLMGYDVPHERNEKYSVDNAHLVAQIRNDARLTEAIKIYFGLSDKKREKVIEFINLLADD